jgi:hypothetical protein
VRNSFVSNAPRRNRFQFHLSTAIVLMFAAGVLMWANTRERKEVIPRNLTYIPYDEASEDLPGDPIVMNYGWPFDAAWRQVGASMPSSILDYSITALPHDPHETYFSMPGSVKYGLVHALWNAATALALLALTAFVAENSRRAKTPSVPSNSETQ